MLPEGVGKGRVQLGGRTVDLSTGEVEGRGVLRPRELALLAFLLEQRGRVVPEEELLASVWGFRAEVRTRTLYSTVYRLRALIEDDPRKPALLVAERGEGYRLVLPEVALPLPPQELLDRLIGRAALVEMLLHELHERRLVVLVGGPGIGKSRLAAELALRQARLGWRLHRVRAASGAWLSSLASEAGLQPERGDESALQARVQRALAERSPALIVLDDADQLGDAERAGLERLLGAVPGLALVATARGVLGLQGERVVEVGPLALPDAVELLQDRIGPSPIGLGEPAPGALERIARRVEGIPLALVLAASLVRLLGVQNTEDRLTSSLSTLDLVNPAAPGLAAAIERALDALAAPDREALMQLAVFRGGFGLEAASAVLGQDATEPVLRLRRSSLLRRVDERFVLFDAVREFVAARAPPPLWQQAAVRHGEHFLALLELRPQLRSERYGEVRRQVAPDLANVEGAVGYLASAGRTADACALLAFLFDLREADAGIDELLALLERGHLLAGKDERRFWFDATRARLYASSYRPRESIAAAEQGYEVVRSGDPVRRAGALAQLVASYQYAGLQERAQALTLELEEELPRLPARTALEIRLKLAMQQVGADRPQQAVAQVEALLPMMDELEADPATRAFALGVRATGLALFDPARAEVELRELRAWHLRAGLRHRADQVSLSLAHMLLRDSRPEEALSALAERADTESRGLEYLRAWACWSWGDVAGCEQALARYLQGSEQDPRHESAAALAMGQVQRSLQRPASAQRWFVRAIALVQPIRPAWAQDAEAWLADLSAEQGQAGPARERMARLGPGWLGCRCAELRLARAEGLAGTVPELHFPHDLCDRIGRDLVLRAP
jgi:predicted ATPase